MPDLPTYSQNKMKGNIGEALAQYVLSRFCLVHKIDGSNDVGNDFICELIKNEYPTNLLFYVQVKYTKRKPYISKTTLEYWKDSPIPVYLFWIKDVPSGHADARQLIAGAQYRRETPGLHGKTKTEKFKHFDEGFFKKDLLIDYTRTQYFKGFTPILRPRDFLKIDDKIDLGFGIHHLYIEDVIPEYTDEVLAGSWVNFFSTAVLLFRQERFVEAKAAILLAKMLCTAKAREKYGSIAAALDRYVERIAGDDLMNSGSS